MAGTTTLSGVHGSAEHSSRFLPLLLILFLGSGCAALIYQVVWFQMLQLVIGSSAVSLAVLLGTFMGGMCAGSLLLARIVSPARHPLHVYAWLEGLIGVCGAALIILMPPVSRLYTAADGGGQASIALRAIVCALLLLPPTVLMGATLPAIARYVQDTPRGVSWLGFFYGGNIVGAVVGCVAAGFYLLRTFDMSTAALIAVAINLLVAALGFMLSRRAPHSASGPDVAAASPALKPDEAALADGTTQGIYVAVALSGLTALGAEIVWTRLLSLMFGATTYAFSIILAVFLTGLGLGSVAGSWLAREARQPRAALAWAQFLVALATAWGAYMIARELPWWPINELLASPWLVFQVDLARALFAVLPAAVLWGASFPIALAAASEGERADAGRTVGRVYAANTLGAIVGSVITGLVLIPWVGTRGAQQSFIVLSVVSGVLIVLPLLRRRPPLVGLGGAAMACALAVTGLYFASRIPGVPAGLIAWGRSLPWQGEPNTLYLAEGMNASIAVTEDANGYRNFHVSGKVEASTEPQDMRLQRLLGHLSALMHDGPKSVLVVGFGAGATAGAISVHPTLERMVICEIEPLIPKAVSQYFDEANHGVAENGKVSIVVDDARHFVLTTREKFDVITSDPIHPWVKGAATLYTQEYFEHVKAHLNPGGVVTQWVPLYESTPDVVRAELATFFSVFPNGSVWRNDNTDGRGYDAVLVARLDDKPIDVDALQTRLAKPEYEAVNASLREVGYESVFDLLGTYIGRARELEPWLEGAEINQDRNLRLQYLAGLGYNESLGTEIRNQILTYRTFPPGFFTGSPASLAYLNERIMSR